MWLTRTEPHTTPDSQLQLRRDKNQGLWWGWTVFSVPNLQGCEGQISHSSCFLTSVVHGATYIPSTCPEQHHQKKSMWREHNSNSSYSSTAGVAGSREPRFGNLRGAAIPAGNSTSVRKAGTPRAYARKKAAVILFFQHRVCTRA